VGAWVPACACHSPSRPYPTPHYTAGYTGWDGCGSPGLLVCLLLPFLGVELCSLPEQVDPPWPRAHFPTYILDIARFVRHICLLLPHLPPSAHLVHFLLVAHWTFLCYVPLWVYLGSDILVPWPVYFAHTCSPAFFFVAFLFSYTHFILPTAPLHSSCAARILLSHAALPACLPLWLHWVHVAKTTTLSVLVLRIHP